MVRSHALAVPARGLHQPLHGSGGESTGWQQRLRAVAASPSGTIGTARPLPAGGTAHPPDIARARGGGVVDTGMYTCSVPGAGFFRIEIRDGSQYVDRAGKSGSYSFDAASGRITFSSGSLSGQYSKLLKPGKFGLASSPTGQFYTVCNLRR